MSFWNNWSETHSPLLRSFEAIAFYYARAWFNCRLHPLAALEIESLPETRLSWLKAFSGSGLEVMFEPNKDQLWLQLSYLSSLSDKWKILKRTLIPARIAPLGDPAVQVRYKRVIQPGDTHRLVEYLAYLITRSAAHSRAIFKTFGRALLWRLSDGALSRIRRRVSTGHIQTQSMFRPVEAIRGIPNQALPKTLLRNRTECPEHVLKIWTGHADEGRSDLDLWPPPAA
jgi:hypothetical protein